MIINNKLEIQFNKDNIDKDFDIYKLTKGGEKKHFNENILDTSLDKFQAKSVAYTWGKDWYVLFDKGAVDKNIFKNAINEEERDIIVKEINIKEDFIFKNVLSHLILNTINNQDDEYRYNNLAGKLYFLSNSWINKSGTKNEDSDFYGLELQIDKDFFMNLSVKTFSKVKFHKESIWKKKSKYVFDKKTNILRRKLKGDNINEEDTYIVKSSDPSKHNNIPFLEFANYNKYLKCKVGVFEKFLNDVEDELSDYIKITNGGYEEYEVYNIKDKTFENKDYGKIISQRQFIIEDLVKTDDSIKARSQIVKYLKIKYNIDAKVGKSSKKAYNLRIIYNFDYYVKNKLEDPHNNAPVDYIIQHITVDSLKDLNNSIDGWIKEKKSNKDAPQITKILQELIIKGDIIDRKMSLVNWNECNYDSSITFVKHKEIKGDKKEDKIHKYYVLEIFKEGNFDFRVYYNSAEIELGSEAEIIDSHYNSFNGGERRNIEGLFYTSIDNINTIFETNQRTMPDYKNLSKRLKDSNPDKKINVEEVIEALNNYVTEDIDLRNRKDELVLNFKKLSKYSTLKDVNKMLEVKKKTSKVINRYIYDNTGILINPETKNSDFIEEYFIPILDIKYFEDKSELYYFVGNESRALKQGLHNACKVRKVKAYGVIEFEKVVKLLTVEFVKNGQNTVKPFPFKYLNEIASVH